MQHCDSNPVLKYVEIFFWLYLYNYLKEIIQFELIHRGKDVLKFKCQNSMWIFGMGTKETNEWIDESINRPKPVRMIDYQWPTKGLTGY